jgi:Resolvase, N terminal domain
MSAVPQKVGVVRRGAPVATATAGPLGGRLCTSPSRVEPNLLGLREARQDGRPIANACPPRPQARGIPTRQRQARPGGQNEKACAVVLAAIYTRKSNIDERSHKDGKSIGVVFADDAISGAEFVNRPGYQRMMEAAQQGQFRVLVMMALKPTRPRSGPGHDFHFTGTRCVGQRPFPSLAHSAHNCRAPIGQRRALSPPRSAYECPQQHTLWPVITISCSVRRSSTDYRRRRGP